MTKQELIKKIANKVNQLLDFTTEFYQIIEDTLIESIKNNNEAVLSSKIGKFVLAPQSERIIKRVTDQKEITIPVRTAVIFKISKTIKDKVKDIDLNKIK
ncbi:HU family DNA-binding protein [Candidatus Phytoplasma sp. AldY-WA1]|uniref:HU family DNA-binding protein n=1 Tax=Candidatus Phytoplasma sp. AldY-WA1 TaxID=2852100 RepID=UPI00254CD9CE|nr:HU family DNA-binding protein [Candidatus Phytoplasma sp. AldY-WA1]